jgi:E3 ubiquitin-protein ligase HERC2
MEYNHLHGIPLATLRHRLILLHHFSELFCASLPMFDLTLATSVGGGGLGAISGLITSTAKETAFRRVVQATMVRDRQHGPVIEINRIQVKRSRTKGGPAGPGGVKSVFGQVCAKLGQFGADSLMLPHRVWKVKFVGESVDDCGGGYSESVAEMCDELQNGAAPLLIQTPNGRDESGSNRDCYLLNPDIMRGGSQASTSQTHNEAMFRFLGVLCGVAIRTGSPLSLSLAEPVWRQLAGLPLTMAHLTEVDKDYLPGLIAIRDMDDAALRAADLPFSAPASDGREVALSARYTRVTPDNKQEYVKMALNFRLHEFDREVCNV